jgi:hypothetical protein
MTMTEDAVASFDHPPRHIPQQMLQKGHHILQIERAFLAGEIPFALRRDGTDGREVIARLPLPEHGCVPHRGIGAYDTGQG